MHTVATAGHVDHGKSTLLRALTGMEPDRWDEERERGLTIDLGFVWTTLPGMDEPTAFVDVPGHERFVGNMLAGAGAVALALLVVAADDGWSAQSQEHLDILDLLDVRGAVVAISKVALAGEDRGLEVAADVEQRLVGTALEGAPVLLTDAVAGTGVDELSGALAERLAATPRLPDTGRPRLWIDRSFVIEGAGTVVTGTLAGGTLATGEAAVVLPGGLRGRIRGLHSLGEEVRRAGPGARVAVNLAGVDHDAVGRGDALVAGDGDPSRRWIVTDEVDAAVTALPGMRLEHTGAWHLHVGSARTGVEVVPVLGEPITAGGFARLRLQRPLPLQTGDRFVVRDSGRETTAGGGEILDPAPSAPARGPDQRLEHAGRLELIAARPPEDRLGVLVVAGGGARPAREVLPAARRDVSATAHPAEPAGTDPEVELIADWVVTAAARDGWERAVVAGLEAEGAERRAQTGTSRAAVAAAAERAGCPPELAAGLPDHLVARGTLVRQGPDYVLPGQVDAAAAARAQRRESLLERLRTEPLSPPKLEDAAQEAGADSHDVQALLQEGTIVRAGELAFTAAAVEDAVARLRRLEDEVGAFTAAQAKEAWETTRRSAIPLLELLDARGVTDFDGTLRTLR